MTVEAAKPARAKNLLPAIDWTAIVRSPAFMPAVLFIAAIAWMFWDLMDGLPKLWGSEDGYYSHGYIVPLFAAWMVVKKWDRIKTIPVKGSWFAIIPLLFLAYMGYVTTHFDIQAFLAATFLLFLVAGVWFVAGWKWALVLAFPILYLGFALPLWTGAIDLYTNPAQVQSTNIAYKLLDIGGYNPYRSSADPTTIYLSNFQLDVAVPCSGLKLILAITAFTAFFVAIAGLKWWGNTAMILLILPLCLFINGLRIALIGVVGDMYGAAAGMKFHDYSGYIVLVVCFFVLFKTARALGWKD
jgi:exosortase